MDKIRVYDFEYDGITLSSLGYTMCTIDINGVQKKTNGAELSINTVETLNGSKHELIGTKYTNCLSSTFQICKNLWDTEDFEISVSDLRMLSGWLGRNNFNKLKFISEEYVGLYYEATFTNITRIEGNEQLIALELTVTTNRPYALHEPVGYILDFDNANTIKTIYDIGDVEGYIYPQLEITLGEDGDLVIQNDMDTEITSIKNCSAGEVITIKYPLIKSSFGDSRDIQNDFNYNFPRIFNKFRNKENRITVSIPCEMKIIYSPAVKVGL